ncbi:MAG: zf-TFIIB domain-containing protein [Rhodoferax sp.]|nr:zf-TFIIB domain-containing protein [Rhodoferax sp.]
MKCPVCTTPDLLMSERQGIEIDYCPQCRGVWLDRGELDKIIERSLRDAAPAASIAPVASAPSQPMHAVPPPPYYQARHGHDDKHHDYSQGYPRKKSVWQELFD